MSTLCLNSLIHEEILDTFCVVFLAHDRVYASIYLESIDEQCFQVSFAVTLLYVPCIYRSHWTLSSWNPEALFALFIIDFILCEHKVVVLFNFTVK